MAYAQIGAFTKEKIKAFSLRDVALTAEKVTVSKASLYFSTDICCLHVPVL